MTTWRACTAPAGVVRPAGAVDGGRPASARRCARPPPRCAAASPSAYFSGWKWKASGSTSAGAVAIGAHPLRPARRLASKRQCTPKCVAPSGAAGAAGSSSSSNQFASSAPPSTARSRCAWRATRCADQRDRLAREPHRRRARARGRAARAGRRSRGCSRRRRSRRCGPMRRSRRCCASSRTTSRTPRSISPSAVARPAKPAPTMHTSASMCRCSGSRSGRWPTVAA